VILLTIAEWILLVLLWAAICSLPASGLIILWTMYGGMNPANYRLKKAEKPHIGQKVMFAPKAYEWCRRGTVVGFELQRYDRDNMIHAVIVRRLFRYKVSTEAIWEVPTENDRHYRKVYHDIAW
jgi:hypothetical protein